MDETPTLSDVIAALADAETEILSALMPGMAGHGESGSAYEVPSGGLDPADAIETEPGY